MRRQTSAKNRLNRLLLTAVICLAGMMTSWAAQADRIKDIADIAGVRGNQLVGYGLVVGLDGTGASSQFAQQSIISMLGQMGVNLPPGKAISLKNVSAVMLTATLPAFARPGQQIDVTVSALDNAKSLRGGTLLMSPLKGGDGQTYAMAQGNVLVGGAGASGGGSSQQVNHLDAGRISNGATVERAVQNRFGQGDSVQIELRQTDFTTANRAAKAINLEFGEAVAVALDGRLIQVKAPNEAGRRIAFLSQLENVSLSPGLATPKVIINPRTGSIVMNQLVNLDKCAIAHGNLSVTISSEPLVSQPGALSGGQTVVTQKSDVQVKSEKGELVVMPATASLSDVVKALNAVGATPQDLLAILQAMKAAGALKADLEVI
ncbi:MAG: flagellar biosynthesis protein FlgI [Hydrogenophilales bacterium CG03_land_8_20_14_0_80_62_28]|nr:flagellar basal body P-ring protein FlgI [Betaproteobacteria bacterium]PIV22059.1 MAG: flagellar biosynthesis protein FlgI [Hydrogenophilales bacterium CG03_land_8_20_14_0_80_62_28]PIW37996.1 MAG: flagellar biosynthesis protein FlgI [Hydrogenophilales bacterium CG15_BIG_FIL_POST_REV_8_21_14_020_62_31]PIW72762.1 MAG: flagellar biosynthesis protein FlgI [Hydrogenophilales bacterium CG12_big_fil_rev_8_21_14_0_65_61_21]PIY98873.1 MAG: flagellar biosynthesis protein FlgI [Hydrogenophilales bacter